MLGCYVLEVQYFLMIDRKGVVLEGRQIEEELGGVAGGKTVVRIYCMRK